MKSSKSGSKPEALRGILTRGVHDAIERPHLTRALRGKKKLRVKLGIDPTAPGLHLGHAVVLRKLRQFQDLGHKAVLIIGDFTGMIGDPSGQSKERKPLTKKEVEKNMQSYLAQAGKIIDVQKAEVRHNSEWLGKLDGSKILELLAMVTVNRILEREDFSARMREQKPLRMHELLYPILQAYDSVIIRADVELGGTDQTFNLLAGRTLMERMGLAPQDILTVPLLEGTDGVRKMSKSYGNYIGLNERPAEMYGKIMSIGDALIVKYFLLCTDVPEAEVKEMERDMKKKALNPRDAKARLAWEIVALYHGESAAETAEEEFVRVFRKRELPGRMPTLSLGKKQANLIVDILIEAGAATSKSEARRLVTQGAVRVNERQATDPRASVKLSKNGTIFRVGKKTFFKVKAK